MGDLMTPANWWRQSIAQIQLTIRKIDPNLAHLR